MNKKTLSRKICILITLLLISAIAVAGCVNKNQNGTTDNGKDDQKYIPDFGGTANIACNTPNSLNPLKTAYNNVADMLFFVYEGLFTANEDLTVNPVLAQKYTVSTSNKMYAITLKQGVKFHDGRDFTSADVIATMDYLKNYETNYSQCVADILSYTAVDDYTVNIELINPQPDFMAVMDFPILPRGLTKEAFEAQNQAFIPNGTGRYKFASSNQLRGITLTKNSEWHGKDATYIQDINVEYLDDEDAIFKSFNSGELDMITTSDLKWGEFSFSADIKGYECGTGSYTYIGVNADIDFLSDKENRKAIASQIDKKDLCEAVVFKHGYPAYTPVISTSQYSKNIQKGTKVKDGNSKKVQNYNVSVYLLYNSESEEKARAADFIKKSLESSGIKIIPIVVDFNTYCEKIKNNDYQLYLGEVKMANNMNMDFMFNGVLKTDQNLCNFASDEFYSLINNYDLLTTEGEQTSIVYTNLLNFFNENVPQIPLYHKTKALYVNPRIKGKIKPNMSTFYGDAGGMYINTKEK